MSANAIAIVSPHMGIDINRVKTNREAVKQLLTEVLKEGIDRDYAKIPGTEKLTLLKPGAEKICALFGLAVEPAIEAIRDGEDCTFRVAVRLSSGGVFIGEGIGEASTLESKFAWRKAICPEEYEATDPFKRRMHWKKGYQGANPTVEQQVRENAADKMNNMLKMAKKRALIDAVLTACAVSDIFTQDLAPLIDQNGGKSTAPVSGQQVEAARGGASTEIITIEEGKKFYGRWKNIGKHTKEEVLEYLKRHCGGITDDRQMPKRCYDDAMKWAGAEGAPVPEVKKAEPAPAVATAKPSVEAEQQKPIDPVIASINQAFGILGVDLAEQAALYQQYAGKMADLDNELKYRIDSSIAEEEN